MPGFVENENVLLYGTDGFSCPEGALWGVAFKVEKGPDFASALMDFAGRFVPVSAEKVFQRRLCVHEVVLNALNYGQGDVCLTASGNRREMNVSIGQHARIVWPEGATGEDFRGTALIRRYAGGIRFSSDKRKIYLLFY